MTIPKISIKKVGSPYPEEFDDVFFDSDSCCQQSEFIFIKGNDVEKKICSAINSNAVNKPFVIAETGFSFGLNFLLTLQLYQKLQHDLDHKNTVNNQNLSLPHLHFYAVEKRPLTKLLLKKTLAGFEHIKSLSKQLISQYPEQQLSQEDNESSTCLNNSSFNAHFCNDQVTLTVVFQNAEEGLATIPSAKLGVVDVWYLDGIHSDKSPDENPDIWRDELFDQIARLSKQQASLTTFTVTEFIERKLRHIGYRLEKRSALGEKAEMIFGLFQSSPLSNKGYQLRPLITKPQHVSLIGGGIASACLAYLLTKQGVEVTLYCKDDEVAQGASSNAIGALYPLIHQKRDDISLFYQQALHHAKTLYSEIDMLGFHFEHDWCGLLEVSYKHSLEVRQSAIASKNLWPHNLIHSVSQEQASKLSGIKLPFGGLFIPEAGWIAPQELVKALFKASKATGRLRIETKSEIKRLSKVSLTDKKNNNTCDRDLPSWEIHSATKTFQASVLVVCAGADTIEFDVVGDLPLNATRGQITSMKSNQHIEKLSTVICHKGYLTPKNNNIHCIGATFQKNDTSLQTRTKDDQYNLNMLEKCLPSLTQSIDWHEKDIASSKARLRCMTPDHLPMVGAMPDINGHIKAYPHLAKDKNWKYSQAAPVIDNLYVMTGFGARGLCSAPIAAEILTAEFCATPYPVDTDMLFNLSPNRFIIRDIIKRKVTL